MANTSRSKRQQNSTPSLVQEVADSLGLNAKEAAVYVAALESGGRSVQAIATAAKTERTGTYDVLERLAKRKLLALQRVGKRTTISVLPPQTVRATLADQLTAVDVVLPRLTSLYQATVDNFSAERGVGMRLVELIQQMLTTDAVVSVRLTLGATGIIDIAETPAITQSLTPLLAYHKTKVLAGSALSSATATWFEKVSASLPRRRLPSSIFLPTSQLIVGDTVITIGLERGEVVGAVVASPSLAAHAAISFDALWRVAKP